jgi:nicotinamidase-related amidase
MPVSELDPSTTALILIDLQQGIVSRELAPYSGAEVAANGGRLADAFRAAGAPVILVHVAWHADDRDRLTPAIDASPPPPGELTADYYDIVDEVRGDGDVLVIKKQWGGFYGTDLDLQLRRRGIRTIVLGGIATNMGVESTARSALEHGYDIVFAEDASSGLDGGDHRFAFERMFPRMGRVAATAEVVGALAGPA